MTTLSPPIVKTSAPSVPDSTLPKRELFGVDVSLAEPNEVVDQVMQWVHAGKPAIADFMSVHSLIVAVRDKAHGTRMNDFDLVACDGQPMRWAMNRFHKADLAERTYGPTAMLNVCKRCAAEDASIYLYGGTDDVLAKLKENLTRTIPNLQIAGAESPPFRALSDDEKAEAVQRINDSGAKVVFLGIGCPKQEIFAHEQKDTIQAVQMCVGAAFNFHAGAVSQAPAWMQARGLEWFYRLIKEPRRLWKRYLVTNSIFVALFLKRLVLGR
ncbi:MAG: WecB/TagA/CpsF family glycosyltransferase [Algisphaera sp.]